MSLPVSIAEMKRDFKRVSSSPLCGMVWSGILEWDYIAGKERCERKCYCDTKWGSLLKGLAV